MISRKKKVNNYFLYLFILKLVELKILKIFIKTNLVNNFI